MGCSHPTPNCVPRLFLTGKEKNIPRFSIRTFHGEKTGIIQYLSKISGLYALRDEWQASPFQVKRPVRSRMQGVVG